VEMSTRRKVSTSLAYVGSGACAAASVRACADGGRPHVAVPAGPHAALRDPAHVRGPTTASAGVEVVQTRLRQRVPILTEVGDHSAWLSGLRTRAGRGVARRSRVATPKRVPCREASGR
jgi:hypothetical protein